MTGRRVLSAVTVAALVLIAGCSNSGGSSAVLNPRLDPGGWSAAAATAHPSVGPLPAGDTELIHRTIDAINAAAGRRPAEQRTVLQRVVDPARADEQRQCRPAATTVWFEPAWPDLRAEPGAAAHRYVLPTRIRIFTADRITGTDVTALTVTISEGAAHLPPLCVS